jgi:valyl-tRNA synthetase
MNEGSNTTSKLPARYDPREAEPRISAFWQEAGVYHFQAEGDAPVYAIDTPPPTVSGHLHLGHTYSYSHPDFLARFWRMNGRNVFYPMGYDDNGLPTERLVEKWRKVKAAQVGRRAFIEQCLQVSVEAERDYEALWKRLGLSVDWRYSYRTIDELSRRTSQLSFLDLYRKGLAYRREAPTIWCPECRTAIAQAEINDLERESEFHTLAFRLADGATLPIATTRPELLPACVAIFVHPEDKRYAHLAGQQVTIPLFERAVPLLLDRQADPQKGTGVVMCCTFGDVVDVEWQRTYKLPLRMVIGRDGRLTETAGEFAGLTCGEARKRMAEGLGARGELLGRQPTHQTVRVHERCDTPVEHIVTPQWYIRLLDFKEQFLEIGERINWHPAHMKARYREWVENLRWDWAVSRQRYYGVPFPVWYCQECGEIMLAEEADLPVDPGDQTPKRACRCGGTRFAPDEDVMDTWATSSLSPQIVGRWLADPALYRKVYPMTLRPQAHDIIRTWAFYTIVKSYHHFGVAPWTDVAISGWGLAGEGMGKISKSRGGGPMAPLEMIERYSADAVRYWAASTGLGRDAVISEEKIQAGGKLATKLWNVARFSERFIGSCHAEPNAGSDAGNGIPRLKLTDCDGQRAGDLSDSDAEFHSAEQLSPADRWILARMQRLIRRATELFRGYDYAGAKGEVEAFFWRDLADNYIEMAKKRLYDDADSGARGVLREALLIVLKLLAPFLPYVTEEIYQHLFAEGRWQRSLHGETWPKAQPEWEDERAERIGETLIEIATAARRFKSEANLPLGTELARLELVTADAELADALREAEPDLVSITRAREIEVVSRLEDGLHVIQAEGAVQIALAR